LQQINEYVAPVIEKLKKAGITVKYDNRETHKPGWKFAEYELKGFPIRLAVGPRDMENHNFEMARRDTLEKSTISIDNIVETIQTTLNSIQENLFNKALSFRNENTRTANSWDEFVDLIENKAGFVSAFWDGTAETEEKIKEMTKATIRCIPLNAKDEVGKCVLTGKASKKRVLFARAY
jgi:prolyl-tRNA synthetase